MRSGKFHPLFRYGLLLALLAMLPFFFIGGPGWLATPLYRAAWSLGHIVFFAVFTVWLQTYWPLRRPRQWLWLTLGVVLVSVVIEGTQALIGRDGNWQDGLRNLTGAWLGLFWFQRGGAWVWLGRLVVTVLLFVQLWPVSQMALDNWHRAKLFPVLSDFEHARDLNHWSGPVSRVQEPVAQGDFSLEVRLNTERFSGADLLYPPRDWRGYRYLTFELYNPEAEDISLTLRIHDSQHELTGYQFNDRFNHRIQASPGWNHYKIPLDEVAQAPETRAMDMARVRHLGLFAARLPEERIIYLDDVRLE